MHAPESDMLSMSAMTAAPALVADRLGKGLQLNAKAARSATELSEITGMSTIAKHSGRGLLGAAATAYESLEQHGYLTSGDYAKVGILVITTFTPYGWAYGAIDIGVGLTTGTTLTDRLGNAIDKY